MGRPGAGRRGRRGTVHLAVFTVLCLLTTSCATLQGSWQVAVDSMEQVVAQVGIREHRFDAVYLRYFPSSVSLHPKDSLRFILRGDGEPHTVTFGTLVEDAVAAVEHLTDPGSVHEIESLPALRRLPKLLRRTDEGILVERAAAELCFLERGAPPDDAGYEDACAPDEQPAFDGGHSLYNSGWLRAERDTFRMTLDPDIAPGRYRFLCLVHPASMHGTIEVVPPDAERPRPGFATEEGDEELDAAAGGLVAAALGAAGASSGSAIAGVAPAGIPRGYVATFGLGDTEIPVGASLTWDVYGLHSISFRPSGAARRGLVGERDGRLVANDDAWAPVGGPDPPSDETLEGLVPSDDPIVLDGGRWDGEGSRSSGILRAKTPGTLAYTLTFIQPGVYRYLCLVHSRMRGTVVVSDEGTG